ncbi:acyl-CoA carboxylase subunit beta, partial [Brachyspira sp.]|uniref:acyl-CoA carboxylase subunit beta n=1 Tax=Brachyspira sp. TaxID=1977261 RepID=UPI002623DEB9
MQEKINELRKRKEKIEEAGGKDRIEERHKKGKLTARERILHLLDENTFCEIDAFIEHRCSDFGMEKNKIAGEGVVTGYGKINGRQVCVYAQDFTVIGGSLGQMHAAKICKIQDMAIKLGCPCIGINDSGGARIQEGIDSLKGYGDIFYRNVQASGVIPQICVIMGPCAGGAVYSPALMDFIFMTDKSSNMFITGPQVVKAVTGEQVSAEDLGGAFVHSKTSGVASLMFPDEISTLDGVKKLLSYIPQNNLEDVPLENTGDNPNRTDEELSNVLPDSPNKPYDVK